jgi:hypothetical protein
MNGCKSVAVVGASSFYAGPILAALKAVRGVLADARNGGSAALRPPRA